MGFKISIPNGSFAFTAMRAFLFDYWERFSYVQLGELVGRAVTAAGVTVFEWDNAGYFKIEIPGKPLEWNTGLISHQGEAHRRIGVDFDAGRVYFGLSRFAQDGATPRGLYRGGPPRLLSHYLLTETEQVLVGPSAALPEDETGNFTGAGQVQGHVTLGGANFGYLFGTPNRKGLRVRSLTSVFPGRVTLGYLSERPSLWTGGLVLDFFCDCGHSFDVYLETLDGDRVVEVRREYPNDAEIIVLDGGAPVSATLALPTTGIHHVLAGYWPRGLSGGENFALAYDGGAGVKAVTLSVSSPTNLDLERTPVLKLVVASTNTEERNGDARICNLRLWDGELSDVVYTVPTEPDEVFPEFLTDFGLTFNPAEPGLPSIAAIARVEFEVTGLENKTLADLAVFPDVIPSSLRGEALYEVPTKDDDYRDLDSVAETVRCTYGVPTHNRITREVAVPFTLFANPAVANAMVRPLYSLDQRNWIPCVPASDSNPGILLAAVPLGTAYTWYWDTSALALDGETTVYFALGHGVPASLASPNRDSLPIQINNAGVGPETEQLAAIPNPQETEVEITYKLTDFDSLLANVEPEYSRDGGRTWVACTEKTGAPSEGKVNLATSPTGTNHTFVWDCRTDGVRWSWVLFRLWAKKIADPSPRLLVDYRFDEVAPVEQWKFDDPLGVPPQPYPVGVPNYPAGERGHSGNAAAFANGATTTNVPAFGVSCLRLSPGSSRGSIGIPHTGLDYFTSARRGFCIDMKVRSEIPPRAIGGFELRSMVTMLPVFRGALNQLTSVMYASLYATVPEGTAQTTPAYPVPLVPGNWHTVRFCVNLASPPRVTIFFDAVKVGDFTFTLNRFPLADPFYLVLFGERLPGGTYCDFDNVVLLDQFTDASYNPAVLALEDGWRLEWYADHPQDESGLFTGDVALAGLVGYTDEGHTGHGLRVA